MNSLPINIAKEKAWDANFRHSDNVLTQGVRVKTSSIGKELRTRTEMLISFSKQLKKKTIIKC